MKKYSKIAYIALIIVILLSGLFIYKVFGKNASNEEEKDKSLAEIKQLENKFVDLFNSLNNISFENYKLSYNEIKEDETENTSESDSSQSSGKGQSGSSGSSGSSNSSATIEENYSASKNNKQYNLESNSILTGSFEPDWKQIKSEVENMYRLIYPTTLDLYQTVNNQNDIVNFNKEFDNLTKSVKDENKYDTLIELSILYNYLPKFFEDCTNSEKEKIVIKTKNNIFKAYSILDQEEWATISESVNNAAQEFTKLVTDVNSQEKTNQYNINKAYVMINELQNAVLLKDKEVFLIKYRNVLEELQNV